ncbi:MAG: polyamine transporter PotB [Actinomycetota bacterium]|nr:MAG: polyamine transporter PotB [Actinomycetota bacterium]
MGTIGLAAEAASPRRRRDRSTLGLISGPLGYLVAFFVVPVVLVGAYSVGALTLLPQDHYLSLRPWVDLLQSDVYLGLFWKSVRMSLIVSVASLVMAYPVAYFLALVAGRRKYTLLLITIAPFLTSYLLRVLAWRVILGEQGLITSFLRTVGLLGPEEGIRWLFYSPFAVYLVLSYVWVPFVALPIFVTLEGLDRALLEASSDLGAGRWRTFWTITFPLSIPGVIAAFIFVFIPTIGEYVTPLLVGGPDGFMFGNAIQGAFTQGFDWQFGSAMSMFLIGTVTVLIVVFGRYLNVRTVAE